MLKDLLKTALLLTAGTGCANVAVEPISAGSGAPESGGATGSGGSASPNGSATDSGSPSASSAVASSSTGGGCFRGYAPKSGVGNASLEAND